MSRGDVARTVVTTFKWMLITASTILASVSQGIAIGDRRRASSQLRVWLVENLEPSSSGAGYDDATVAAHNKVTLPQVR